MAEEGKHKINVPVPAMVSLDKCYDLGIVVLEISAVAD